MVSRKESLAVAMFLLIMAISGAAYGLWLVLERENGLPTTNWLREDAFVLANGVRWTWGVFGPAGTEPDMWHFDLTFLANQTLRVRLFWGGNQTILYSRAASSFEDSFEVPLPRTADEWRMDWQVFNPNPTDAAILNFTVRHYAVTYPHRSQGIAILAGSLTLLVVPVIVLASTFLRYRARTG